MYMPEEPLKGEKEALAGKKTRCPGDSPGFNVRRDENRRAQRHFSFDVYTSVESDLLSINVPAVKWLEETMPAVPFRSRTLD